jgi:NTP pyrophosphatase (non-canonical NTP hydrolase)
MGLSKLTSKIVAFRDARDWRQFHSPDQLAKAISIEAAELQEHFLWKSPEQVRALITDPGKRAEIGEEVADILNYALLLSHELALDPVEIITDKLVKNAKKYPVEKVKGSAKKYTEYMVKKKT